jgi:hypothetical protein
MMKEDASIVTKTLMRYVLMSLLGIAGSGVCVGSACAQTNVSLVIKVVRERNPDREGEESPVSDEKVYVCPYSGNVPPGRTDSNGIARFSFPATAYVSVYIGDPRLGRRLPRMSGRFNQNTSIYLKGGFAGQDGDLDGLLEFSRDVKHSRSGTELPPALAKDIEKILSEKIPTDDSVDSEGKRREVFDNLREALTPVGKIGVSWWNDDRGTVIRGLERGLPAEEAGIEVGDRIISVDGRTIGRNFTLPKAFARAVDGRVRIEVVKGDRSPAAGEKPKIIELRLAK